MNEQNFDCNGIKFSVVRLPNCIWPWIWKATQAMSGRCYPTMRAAREAAERYLEKFGDTPVPNEHD